MHAAVYASFLPFIHVPLNGFHFRELPLISDNVIRLPFTREPSSSARYTHKKKEGKKEWKREK